jgi:hypothetical protein
MGYKSGSIIMKPREFEYSCAVSLEMVGHSIREVESGRVEKARCGLNCRYEPRGQVVSGWQREGSSRHTARRRHE